MNGTLGLMCEMPELTHYVGKLDGYEYDAQRSEVLSWIGAQHGLLEWVLCRAYDKGMVKYDKERNVWYGVKDWVKGESKQIAKKIGVEERRTILNRMGELEWSIEGVCVLCRDMAGKSALRRAVNVMIANGYIEKKESGKIKVTFDKGMRFRDGLPPGANHTLDVW